MNYIIISTIILLGIILFLIKPKTIASASIKTPNIISQQVDTPSKKESEESNYMGLRHLALTTTAEQLGLTIPNEKIKVYGVIMDLDMGKGFATFISFLTGDASFYLSNGGGAIGGIKHKNVQDAAKEFVTTAQSYIEKATKVDDTPMPDKNCVRFYFLTNKGLFSTIERLDNIDNHTSIWLPLFKSGNKVGNELASTMHH